MTNMKWHDAITDPPKEDGEYLAYIDDGSFPFYEVMTYDKEAYRKDTNDFWSLERVPGWYYEFPDCGTCDCSYVKYWMELPKPPNSGERK